MLDIDAIKSIDGAERAWAERMLLALLPRDFRAARAFADLGAMRAISVRPSGALVDSDSARPVCARGRFAPSRQ